MNRKYQTVIRRYVGLGLTMPVAILGLLTGASAVAQTDSSEIFEEIIVTVQRRDTALMATPVAVGVLSGTQLNDAGIKDMQDVQQNVPSLIVGQSQSSTTTNFAIRGIGSTSQNFGVESSVGLYVDGVYRSRQSSLINELVDINTVQVLRGPQGTLFGKNTAAGAILLDTVRPNRDRDAFVDATVGDYDLVRVSAAANIPIGENSAFRATIFSSQRDGYVDDRALGNDLYNDRDRLGVRLQWAINELDDDFNVRIIADYAEIDEACCAANGSVDSLYSRASLAGIPQNGSDAVLLGLGGTVFTDFPYPQPFLDALAFLPGTIVTGVGVYDNQVAYSFAPRSTNEDSGLSVEINKTFNNGITLTSISAYRAFETFDHIDIDFTNVDMLERINIGDQSSFSQEFRLAGEFGQSSHYVVGLYYFTQEIKSSTVTSGGIFLEPYLLTVQPALQQAIDGLNLVSAGSGGLIPPAAAPFPAGVTAEDNVTQDHDSWAAFGQVEFALGDFVTATIGARYTNESKDIDARYVQTAQGPPPDLVAIGTALFLASQGQPFDPTPLFAIAEPNAAWGMYLFDPFAPRSDLRASLSDDQSTGTVTLSWSPTDSQMLYASWSTGFKAGGTNTDRINQAFDPIFDAETSESLEFGYKATFGPFRIAATYFETDFDDFQANSFTGTGFNLQNAGKTVIDGHEIEVWWVPTDWLDLQGFYTETNGDFESFVGGTCWDTYIFHTGMPDPGSGGDPGAEVCDKSGFPIPYNPRYRAFLAATTTFAVGNNSELFIRGEFTHASSQWTDGDLDPFTFQESYDVINLRIGINFGKSNSNLTIWGRNIGDERWIHGSFDAPIQEFGRMNGYPSEPATYGITYRKTFD